MFILKSAVLFRAPRKRYRVGSLVREEPGVVDNDFCRYSVLVLLHVQRPFLKKNSVCVLFVFSVVYM